MKRLLTGFRQQEVQQVLCERFENVQLRTRKHACLS